MRNRTKFEALIAKRAALRDAEAAGQIADSTAVRMALIARMDAGELTPQQVQAELKRIQREAKKAGRPTRASVFSGA